MSHPYYGPENELPSDILIERFFVAGDFICGVGYGAQIVLWTNCVLYLWKTRKTRPYSTFLLAYITLLITISTTYMVAQARTVQDMYIDNRNYPGGPWQYFLATQYLAENVIFCATLFVLTFLSDLLILWRCWVIWTSAGRLTANIVIAVPGLMTLASFALGTLWTLQSAHFGLYTWSSISIGTAYYAVSLGVNIILTTLIVIRLLLYRRELQTLLPEDRAWHYVSVSAIMVESAALYSVLALAFIVSYAVNHPINQIFLGSASSAQQIAGYLIIYRLAEGKAWRKNTLIMKHGGSTYPTLAVDSKEATARKKVEISTFRAIDPSFLEASTPGAESSDYTSTLGSSPVVLDEKINGIWRREKLNPADSPA